MRGFKFFLLAIAAIATSAQMPNDSIAAYLAQDKSLSQINAALTEAGLSELLSGDGDFTLLVPSDEALAKLPPEKLSALLKPTSKDELKSLLSFHIIRGRFSDADLRNNIRAGSGYTSLTTINGQLIGLTFQGNALWLWDKSGVQTVITGPEHVQSNGVIYLIDKPLTPKAD